MKCQVINMIDTTEKDFFVCDGIKEGRRLKIGEEVDLSPSEIEVLENSIWEHKVGAKGEIDGFRYQTEGKTVFTPRFRVIRLEDNPVRSKSEQTEISCPICERNGFKTKETLERHMKIHKLHKHDPLSSPSDKQSSVVV